MGLFGDDYPRKPLTRQQLRENRQKAVRVGRAEAEYERGKEALRDRLAKKWGVEWQGELEGDWEVADRYPPHVAEFDLEKFTPKQQKSWEFEQQYMKDLREMYSRSIIPNLLMKVPPLSAEDGKTIKFVRHGWNEDKVSETQTAHREEK